MASIHITDIESAINFWRTKAPSGAGAALSPEMRALAELYGVMAFERTHEIDEAALPAAALQAWLTWFDNTPDTPCIAICSTNQGNELCKVMGGLFPKCNTGPKCSQQRNGPVGGASLKKGQHGASTSMPNAPPKGQSEMPPDTSITSPLM